MDDARAPTWTNTQQVIAFALVFSFVAVIFVWMIWPPKAVDQSIMTVVNMLLGALVAKVTTIVDFFFGSSQGSKDKDDSQNKVIASLTGTGPGAASMAAAAAAAAAPPAAAAAAPAAAVIAAPAAAAEAAVPAAIEAAPPAAEAAAPAAAEAAVRKELGVHNVNPEGKSP